MKSYPSDQYTQKPTLPLKLNASAIIGHTIHRVTLEDVQKLEAMRRSGALLENLKHIISENEQNLIKQREENILHDILAKCIPRICLDTTNCPYRSQISPACTACLFLKTQIDFFITDNTITYYYTSPANDLFSSGPTMMFNSSKDLPTFLSHFSCKFKIKLNAEELKAILHWHRRWIYLICKNPEIRELTNVIIYCTPLHIIHYQLAQNLLLLYHAATAIVSHDDSAKQIDQLQHERNNIFYKKFHIPPTVSSFINERLTAHINHANNTIRNNLNSNNVFVKLTNTFLDISKGNPVTIKKLAIMLAKVFIGRAYLDYLDKDTNHLTHIITNNPHYVKKFFMDIFLYNPTFDKSMRRDATKYSPNKYLKKLQNTYYHLTEYSAARLSDEKNIGELIKDKYMGNIVNIDTTTTFATSNFKNLVSGKTISVTDNYFGKLCYKSNAHYIRINQYAEQCGLNNCQMTYDTIIFDGDLTNAIYDPLDDYELFFLVTGFLNYGVDLLSQTDQNLATIVPSSQKLIYEFIDNFCTDVTNTITIPDNETFNKQFKSAKAKRPLAKQLGITALQFTHFNTIYKHFQNWMQAKYKDIPCCLFSSFRNILSIKYNPLFQAKKSLVIDGARNDSLGLYGLTIKEKELESYTKTEYQEDSSIEEQQKNFISFMENTVLPYFLNSAEYYEAYNTDSPANGNP